MIPIPVRLLGALTATLVVGAAVADVRAPGDVTIENIAVAESVSGMPGDPVAGRATFADKSLGNCLACHVNADLSDQLFHGEVGPSLDGVGGRWSEEQLRAIIVNAKAVFTDQTIMPAFYSLDVGENVREDLVGKTILSAQQVEDVVAYLNTLR
mgnify:CR=1 FL=1